MLRVCVLNLIHLHVHKDHQQIASWPYSAIFQAKQSEQENEFVVFREMFANT